MAVNTVEPAGNLLTSDDTDRGLSRHVWHDCPLQQLLSGDNSKGVAFFDQFTTLPKTEATTEGNFGLYSQFASATGSITAGTGQGGEWVFGATEDNEGVSIRTGSTPFKIARTTKKFWFEVRLKSSTITDTKHGFFVGLMQDVALTATMPIAADGTIGDTNLAGFHRLEGDGDQIDTIYKADGVTQVTVDTDALNTALVADTYTKLGMVYEPDPDLYSGTKFVLTFFQNGRRLAETKTIPSTDGDDFPNDVALGLVFALLNATGTAEGTTTLDWWGAAQLFY